MENLRNVDVYYCKLLGSCEQLFLLHRLTGKTYYTLIRLFIDHNSFPSHHCLSESDKNWWNRFIDDSSKGESFSFLDWLRLIKRHSFWIESDSDYLKFIYVRVQSFVDWCYDYFQESVDLPF